MPSDTRVRGTLSVSAFLTLCGPQSRRWRRQTRAVELEQLAYEEAKRAIDRQSDQLDGLRGRGGILLGAVSLATSFLAGLALDGGDLSTWATVAAIVATIAFIVAAGMCVAILWPRAEWGFNLSAGRILQQLDALTPTEAEAYRELALRIQGNYRANRDRLDVLFWLFRIACIALGVETLAWLVTLAL